MSKFFGFGLLVREAYMYNWGFIGRTKKNTKKPLHCKKIIRRPIYIAFLFGSVLDPV